MFNPFSKPEKTNVRLASAALLTMYFGNEEMTEADGIRPSPEGIALSKDAWLVAIGAGLMALPSK